MQYQKRHNNVLLRVLLAACCVLIRVQSFSLVVPHVEHSQQQKIDRILYYPSLQASKRSCGIINRMVVDDNENITTSSTSDEDISNDESEEHDTTESEIDEDFIDENDEETMMLKKEIEDETNKIKEEISKLEMDLKSKRRTLIYYNDLADEFTKAGYARKVAEMENMRRARSSLASSNRFSATASTLTEFLPILDAVETLREKYEDDAFGKQYNAVASSVKGAFTELGVTSFDVKVGNAIDDRTRIDVVESRYSSEYPKGSVIEVISTGMELKGNIVRPAKCVVSLGVEEPESLDDEKNEENAETVNMDEKEAANAES